MPISLLPNLDRFGTDFLPKLDAFFGAQLNTFIAQTNAEIERINALGFGSYTASSSTSLSVAAGSKTLSIETGKGFTAGQGVVIANTAAPTNYLQGQVTSYNSNTGALVVDVKNVSGVGTFSAWSVSVALPSMPAPTLRQRAIVAADTLIATDATRCINANGTYTLAITAAAALGDGWYCIVRNTGNGSVVIDPNGAELIDGQATYTLAPGFAILLLCNGVGFSTLTLKRRTYSAQLITASTTVTVPADTYVVRAYGVSAGAAGTTAASGAGGGMGYGDIAVTPGEVITITINAGTFKVTTQGVDRLTGAPASGVTPGTATKHASVTNGGAYSGGAGVTSGTAAGASSGSPLGNGFSSTFSGAGWGGIGSQATGGGGVNAAKPGHGFDSINSIAEPLLSALTGAAGFSLTSYGPAAGGVLYGPGGAGGPGAGGGVAAGSRNGGAGGFGGGGGYGDAGNGGAGGFGGGGGAAQSTGGAGGCGGGGGCGGSTGGAGGAPAVILMM